MVEHPTNAGRKARAPRRGATLFAGLLLLARAETHPTAAQRAAHARRLGLRRRPAVTDGARGRDASCVWGTTASAERSGGEERRGAPITLPPKGGSEEKRGAAFPWFDDDAALVAAAGARHAPYAPARAAADDEALQAAAGQAGAPAASASRT